MIQRIQTVYLALVAVLSILGLCLPLAQYFVGTAQVATFNSFTYTAAKGYDTFGAFSMAPLAFGVLLSIVILLTSDQLRVVVDVTDNFSCKLISTSLRCTFQN